MTQLPEATPPRGAEHDPAPRPSPAVAAPVRVRRSRDGAVWTETHEPGGRLQRLFGPVFITGILWVRLLNTGARFIPKYPGMWIVWFATIVSWVMLRRVRRGISGNLAVVLGPAGFVERERRIYRTLLKFARCMHDRYRLYYRRDELQLRFEGADHWQRAVDHPDGVIFVSGHYGNWEMMARLPRRERCQLHVVREPSLDPRCQEFLERLYRKYLSQDLTFHYATDDANLGTRLLLALRRGNAIAVSADQPRTGHSFIVVDLFDRPVQLPHGPAALARASGALLVPVFAIWEDYQTYRVVVREPIEAQRTADRDADLRHTTQLVAAQLEWGIRESPHNWFCWYDRFTQTRPADAEA
jgi:KDO2-lipid IV(A) lauroyltransferase